MTPEEAAIVKAAIVKACQNHFTLNWSKRDYRAAICMGTDYFVKFGNPKALRPEIAMQDYVSAYAESHPKEGTPRISKVLFSFIKDSILYMVMEYIELEEFPADPQRRAAALSWLSEVPLPDGHVFGPLEGGRIRHRFFKDSEAPLEFSSVVALERYIDKVRFTLIFSLASANM